MESSILETLQSRPVIFTVLCTLFGLAYKLLLNDPWHGIPQVGKSPSFFSFRATEANGDFFRNGKALLDQGYARYKESMFLVHTSDLPRVVLSQRYLAELRSLPETMLSHRESVCDRFLGYWTGLDAVRQSTLHNEICQTTLVQNLPSLVPSMHEEAVAAIRDNISLNSSISSTPFDTYGSIFNMIARINSRILVGLPLCRDPDWLQVAEGYPQDSVAVAMDLRPYFPWLRWAIYPFLDSARRLKNEYAIAHRKLEPLIDERRNVAAARHQGEERKDVLQWMLDLGTGNDRKKDVIVGKMMFLTMAGFHAPTATAVHVVYDLCAHPNYLAPLRKEIEDELAIEGGVWTLALLRRLKRLDSVIKESQRINSPGLLSFNRKVMQPLTLSDESHLSRGLIIALPVHHITHDPAIWPDPYAFDGFRFYHKRLAEPAKEADHQFAALGANNLGFGYGRLACPGRVFAAAQLKLLLGLLLLEFNFCFTNDRGEGSRPENLYLDDMILPDRSVKVLCTKRT